jgi:hypothetical protein
MPKLAVLSEHGASGGSDNQNGAGAADAAAAKKKVLEDTLAMFRRQGKSEDEIAKTNAARELAALNKN